MCGFSAAVDNTLGKVVVFCGNPIFVLWLVVKYGYDGLFTRWSMDVTHVYYAPILILTIQRYVVKMKLYQFLYLLFHILNHSALFCQ